MLQHWRERAVLQATIASQQSAVESARRMRSQLDAIARGTHRLAAEGNVNAQRVIEDLRRRGVTINPQ